MFTTLDKLRAVIHAKTGRDGAPYRFFENGAYNLNIIGVRRETSKSNEFDDLLLVAYRDDRSAWQLKEYKITTDPGKPWLLKPMDPAGTAVMVPGQYAGAYAIGLHGRSFASGPYKALEQVAPIAYVRDGNKDEKIDVSLYRDPAKAAKAIFWGILKTNIHRASKWAPVRTVETYSAGCQVFQDPKAFEEFLALCERSRANFKKNSFTYTLLEERDFIK